MTYNDESTAPGARGPRGPGRGRFGDPAAPAGRRAHRHGFGPGGPGGPEDWGWGPGFGRGRGRRGPGGRRGPRAQRGDLRLSILYLLAERPMHGYELMAEIADRTSGAWQPSPGSVYPTLSLLEDEGLITAESDGSRRTFTLTEAGRAAAPGADDPAPWTGVVSGTDPLVQELRSTVRAVRVAIGQVMEAGTDADRARMLTLLTDFRRELYLMLAGQGDQS